MNRKSILISSLVFGLLMASVDQCHFKNEIEAVEKEESSEESKVNALKSAIGAFLDARKWGDGIDGFEELKKRIDDALEAFDLRQGNFIGTGGNVDGELENFRNFLVALWRVGNNRGCLGNRYDIYDRFRDGKSNLLESISEERVRSLKGEVPPAAEHRRQPLTDPQQIERMLQRLPDPPRTDPQLTKHQLLQQRRELVEWKRSQKELERRLRCQRELAEQQRRQQELTCRLQLLRDQLMEQQLTEQRLVEQRLIERPLVERRRSGCCGCFGYR